MLSKQNVSQASMILSAFAVFGGLLGYAREGLVAYFFGPDARLDAYLAAFLIPTLLTNLLNATLPFVFINLFNRIRVRSGDEAAWGFALAWLRRLLVALAGLAGVCVLLSPYLFRILAPGFSPDQMMLARHFFLWLAPCVVCSGVYIYVTAILQAFKHFWWPACLALSINFFPILSMLLWGRTLGLNSLALGMLAGFVCQGGVIGLVLLRLKPPGSMRAAPPRIARDEWLHFILPMSLFFGLDQVNLLIARGLASFLEPGSISVMYFSTIILQLIQMIITLPVMRAVYPDVTASLAAGDETNLKNKLLIAVKLLLVVAVPVVLGIVVLHHEIIRLLFERGAFGRRYTELTAGVFLVYALALVPVGLTNVLNLVFFSHRQVWTTLRAAAASSLLGAACALLLMRRWGVVGLGLANLVATGTNLIILSRSPRVRMMRLTWTEMVRPAGRILLLGGMMAVLTWLIKESWNPEIASGAQVIIRLAVNVLISGLFYVGLGYWLKLQEVTFFIAKLRHTLALR